MLCSSLVVGYYIDKDEGMASKSLAIAEISECKKVSKPQTQKSRELLLTLTKFLDLLRVSTNPLVPPELSPEEIANVKGILTQWNCS